MAYNIGEAVALSTKLPSDQGRAFSSIIQRNQDQSYRQRAAQQQKELATLDDFKIDYTKWLPAWGKEAAVIQKDLVNKFHQYQQENPRTAANRLELDKIDANRKLGDLWAGNQNAKDQYLKLQANPKFYYESEVGNAITDPKLSMSEVYGKVSKYSDKGIQMTPEGGFSFMAVEKGDYAPYTKFDKYEEVETEVKSDVPYHKKFDVTIVAPKEQVEARVHALASDPTFQAEQLLYRATKEEKEFLKANPEKAEEYIFQKAREIIQPSYSAIREAPIRVAYARPLQESAAEKKARPKISGNSVEFGNSKWTYFADGNEETYTASRTDVSENKVFDWEKITTKGIEPVSGRFKKITIGKDNVPKIHIVEVADGDDGEEMVVQYTANNIGKIKNEFNANPYEIRAMFTGGANVVPKNTQTGTAAKGTTSNVNKSSSKDSINTKWKGGMKIRGKKSGKTYIWTGKDANDPNGFYAEE